VANRGIKIAIKLAAMEQPADKQPTWVFLSNHAHVLLCIARDPDSRTRDIAEQVGITERAAQRIVAELIAQGYLVRTKVGRRNRYEINRHGHLRHPVFNHLEIGPLLDILDTADAAGPEPVTGRPRSRRPAQR
jgi:predicted ArsR family transcriptional regulator